jgi:hypothetical protein
MFKQVVKSSGSQKGNFGNQKELNTEKDKKVLMMFDFEQKLQLCEIDINKTDSSSSASSLVSSPSSFNNSLRLEIGHSFNEYGANSESLKHQLKTDILSALKLHLNPDLDVNVVQIMSPEDWSHCFNEVYTHKLVQKLNNSIYRLNGVVQTHFNEKCVKNLSMGDQYVFSRHKDSIKLTVEQEIMEMRKIVHVAVGEFLGLVVDQNCEGLICAETFSKLCLSEFRCYVAESVSASGGDLVAITNLFEATKSVVPLLNTGNKRYNQNYLKKRIAETPQKEKESESTINRKRAASAVTIDRRSDAAAAKNAYRNDGRKRVFKCASLANMTAPTASLGKSKVTRASDKSPPPRNSVVVDEEIDSLFLDKHYFYNVFRSKRPSGDLKQHCMLLSRHVMYDFRDCVEDRATVSETNLLIYLHYVLCDAADEIFNSIYDEKMANPYGNFTPLHNNSENPSKNDYLRRSANASYHNNSRLRNIVENIKFMLLQDKVINLQTYFTSGSGEDFSITLLLALVNCKRQQDHFDFDPVLYTPHESHEGVDEKYVGTYLNFNGASLFINFDWLEWQSLDLDERDLDPKADKDEFRKLWMRPMSILVINGNLKHAGSANKSGKVIRKFFLYLDPCSGSRREAVLKGSKEKTRNYIYFDQYSKMVA